MITFIISMKDRFIRIAGIELDLTEELDRNLEILTDELIMKQDFRNMMDRAIDGVSNGDSIFDLLNRFLIRLSLLPKYILYQTKNQERYRIRTEAREMLEEHYQKPETIILRSRLQCQLNIQSYVVEINEIKREVLRLEKDLELAEDDDHIVGEIDELLKKYNDKLNQKESKLRFYQESDGKISKLETKMQVLKNLEVSKQKFSELAQKPIKRDLEDTIKKDVMLYEEYGDLLTKISKNINRISKDKAEQIEEVELKSIVESINI